MSMLAAPRKKEKWSLNPRGKDWSEDSNKYGQKILEKMGWSAGKGLGAKEQGITEHVRVKLKNDQCGIGFEKGKDDYWINSQENFDYFLQNLCKEQSSDVIVSEVKTSEFLSGISLEQKSKSSAVRVHYKKFTKGKDVNKYSEKDLANIFGKKSLAEKVKTDETSLYNIENIKAEFEDIDTEDRRSGVMTIKGGNMDDYFKKKPLFVKYNNKFMTNNDSDSDSDAKKGFGFFKTKSEDIKSSQNNYIFDNPCLNISESNSSGKKDYYNSEFEIKDSKKTYVFDNPCLELCEEIKQENISDDEKELDLKERKIYINDVEYSTSKKKNKTKVKYELDNHNDSSDQYKKQFPDEETELKSPKVEVDEIFNDKSHKSKKYKNRVANEMDGIFNNPCLELNIQETDIRMPLALDHNKKLNLEFPDRVTTFLGNEIEYSTKNKQRKKKKKGGLDNPCLEIDAEEEISRLSKKRKRDYLFMNDALDIQTVEQSTPKKLKNTHTVESSPVNNGFCNEGLDLNYSPKENTIGYNFEISNIHSSKHIVNGSVEPESNKSKKVKKKKKKEKSKSTHCKEYKNSTPEQTTLHIENEGFINEALEEGTANSEEIDNEVNEGRNKKRKRREKRISNLETILEVEEENEKSIEGIQQGTPCKIKKYNHNNHAQIINPDIPKQKHITNVYPTPKTSGENDDEIVSLDEFLAEKNNYVSHMQDKQGCSEVNDTLIKSDVTNDLNCTQNKSKKKKKKDKFKDSGSQDVNSKNPTIKMVNSHSQCVNPSSENSELTMVEFLNELNQKPKTSSSDTKNINIKEKISDPKTEIKTPDRNNIQNGLKASKQIIKSLFRKNPILLFNGSNINEIKGYGSQFYD